MKKAIHPETGVGWKLHKVADRLLSFPGIEPNYLVRIRTYWIMVVGAAVFVLFLTLLVWALGSKTLVWNGITLLLGYGLIVGFIPIAKRPVLWIGVIGQTFTIVVTFVTISILGGLFRSGGIITAAIAAVLFSVFLLRPAWTFFLFALFCVLLLATPFITPLLDFGADLTPFANTLLYIINTLWISGFMAFFMVSFIRDRLHAEEEEARRLKALDAAKTQFYTNISHEFRTPLTIISGMAEQIESQPERWLDEGTEMIKHNSRRILALVNQMLDLSKLDAGKMELRLRQADVIRWLRYLCESFRSYAESRKLELIFETEIPELVMDHDPDKLSDILSNLLSNAVKFTPPGGTISVSVRVEAGMAAPQLLLGVRDTGAGIEPEHVPFVFDRFFRGRQGEDIAGTGIGLSLARALARLSGGDVFVKSKVGEGSEFTLQLPITHIAPFDDVDEKGGHNEWQTVHFQSEWNGAKTAPSEDIPLILVVDDYPDILQYLRSALSERYRVESAANGREGLEKALHLTPDLIISDVMMPEMDGMELCRSLKHNPATSHIPVVLLTARADTDSKLEGLNNKADAYLAKPFSPTELGLILRNLMANREALRTYYLAAAGLGATSETPIPAVGISELEQAFLERAHEVVIQHLDDPDFHVDDLCRAMLMSQSQLHRKLTALTGMPANRFIRQIRLQEAAQLLRSTGLNVAEVAYDTGFRDPDYFGRAFRKMYGMAPTEYREAG